MADYVSPGPDCMVLTVDPGSDTEAEAKRPPGCMEAPVHSIALGQICTAFSWRRQVVSLAKLHGLQLYCPAATGARLAALRSRTTATIAALASAKHASPRAEHGEVEFALQQQVARHPADLYRLRSLCSWWLRFPPSELRGLHEAIVLLERCLAMDPSDLEIRSGLATFRAALEGAGSAPSLQTKDSSREMPVMQQPDHLTEVAALPSQGVRNGDGVATANIEAMDDLLNGVRDNANQEPALASTLGDSLHKLLASVDAWEQEAIGQPFAPPLHVSDPEAVVYRTRRCRRCLQRAWLSTAAAQRSESIRHLPIVLWSHEHDKTAVNVQAASVLFTHAVAALNAAYWPKDPFLQRGQDLVAVTLVLLRFGLRKKETLAQLRDAIRASPSPLLMQLFKEYGYGPRPTRSGCRSFRPTGAHMDDVLDLQSLLLDVLSKFRHSALLKLSGFEESADAGDMPHEEEVLDEESRLEVLRRRAKHMELLLKRPTKSGRPIPVPKHLFRDNLHGSNMMKYG